MTAATPNLGAGTTGDFSLVYQQDGNAIAHRIYSLAAGALQGAFVGSQSQRPVAIRDRAYQGIKHTLQDHPSYSRAFGCSLVNEYPRHDSERLRRPAGAFIIGCR